MPASPHSSLVQAPHPQQLPQTPVDHNQHKSRYDADIPPLLLVGPLIGQQKCV